jgi:hypothetical protein
LSLNKCEKCGKKRKINDIHMPYTRAVRLKYCNDCLRLFLSFILTHSAVAQKDEWVESFGGMTEEKWGQFCKQQTDFYRANKTLQTLQNEVPAAYNNLNHI